MKTWLPIEDCWAADGMIILSLMNVRTISIAKLRTSCDGFLPHQSLFPPVCLNMCTSNWICQSETKYLELGCKIISNDPRLFKRLWEVLVPDSGFYFLSLDSGTPLLCARMSVTPYLWLPTVIHPSRSYSPLPSLINWSRTLTWLWSVYFVSFKG